VVVGLCVVACLAGCGPGASETSRSSAVVTDGAGTRSSAPTNGGHERVDADTALVEVTNNPAFEGFGRFLLPTGRGFPEAGMRVRDAGELMPYHTHVDVGTSVDVVNALIGSVRAGDIVFHDIYTEQEKASDPSKGDTGLFFFAGEPGAPFAIVSAGGGFSYVASLHESLPHALELSRRGFNAFALQYRSGGAQVAYEDLAAAISFVFANADQWGVSTKGYSLWGGSAGARMAASLGSYGPAAYGGDDLPRPGMVVTQYTGHTDLTAQDPPTFVCVGEDDGIANWRAMKARVDALAAAGVDTEFRLYPGLGHGFGLGVGTSAEGWIDDAVAFWEAHRQ